MLKRLGHGACATLPLLLLSLAALAPVEAQQRHPPFEQGGLPLFTGEGSMRRRVVSPVMPAYPEAALRGGVQGVAVALVTHDPAGEVIRVEILKAPDESIAAAVRDTLKQWAFAPPSYRKTTQGTLRFSFTIEGGEGRVEYGSLAGICGQRPGRTMPDGTIRRQTLEDFDMVDCK